MRKTRAPAACWSYGKSASCLIVSCGVSAPLPRSVCVNQSAVTSSSCDGHCAQHTQRSIRRGSRPSCRKCRGQRRQQQRTRRTGNGLGSAAGCSVTAVTSSLWGATQAGAGVTLARLWHEGMVHKSGATLSPSRADVAAERLLRPARPHGGVARARRQLSAQQQSTSAATAWLDGGHKVTSRRGGSRRASACSHARVAPGLSAALFSKRVVVVQVPLVAARGRAAPLCGAAALATSP